MMIIVDVLSCGNFAHFKISLRFKDLFLARYREE